MKQNMTLTSLFRAKKTRNFLLMLHTFNRMYSTSQSVVLANTIPPNANTLRVITRNPNMNDQALVALQNRVRELRESVASERQNHEMPPIINNNNNFYRGEMEQIENMFRIARNRVVESQNRAIVPTDQSATLENTTTQQALQVLREPMSNEEQNRILQLAEERASNNIDIEQNEMSTLVNQMIETNAGEIEKIRSSGFLHNIISLLHNPSLLLGITFTILVSGLIIKKVAASNATTNTVMNNIVPTISSLNQIVTSKIKEIKKEITNIYNQIKLKFKK